MISSLTRGQRVLLFVLFAQMLFGLWSWLGSATYDFNYNFLDLLGPFLVCLPLGGVLLFYALRCDEPVQFGFRVGSIGVLLTLLPMYVGMTTLVWDSPTIGSAFIGYLGAGLLAANLMLVYSIWKSADVESDATLFGFTFPRLWAVLAFGIPGHGLWMFAGPWTVIRNHGFAFFEPADTCMGLGGAGCSFVAGNMHYWGVSAGSMLSVMSLGLALILILLAGATLQRRLNESSSTF